MEYIQELRQAQFGLDATTSEGIPSLTEKRKIIDHSWCEEWILKNVFQFQPDSYCKEHPNWPGLIGLELEMHPFYTDSLRRDTPEQVPLFAGAHSLELALREIGRQQSDWSFKEQDQHLLGISLENNDQISFEPGGQLEISTVPFACLEDAQARIEQILQVLRQGLAAQNISFVASGTNPWFDADQIGLQMQKPRYRAMDRYFNEISPFGRLMMRQTATLQVNLDFGSSGHVMAKRYLLSNLAAPCATAIFANSGISQGRINGYKSLRALAWQGLDPTRTGFPDLQGIQRELSQESCVATYLQRILDCRVVFVEALQSKPVLSKVTFRDWMNSGIEGHFPSEDDFKTHLSLFFPEVRARGFLELRSIDCQSWDWQVVPACFYSGLLYDDRSLDEALALLQPHADDLQDMWKLCVHGLEDDGLADLAAKLMQIAFEGFGRLPSCYHGGKGPERFAAFLSHFTNRRRSPADDVIDAAKQGPHELLTPSALMRVEEKWQTLAEC